MSEENIIKLTCKELGLTQKELADFDNKVMLAKNILKKSATDDLADRFSFILAEEIEKIETEKDVRDWIENKIMSQNIIKLTCKELGLTYKQLGDAIGYSEPAIKKAIANNTVSEPMQKAIELYLEVLNLKKQLQNYESLKSVLKTAIS